MPLAKVAKLALAAILAACLPRGPAAAIDDSGNFMSLGPGGDACSTYLAILAHPTRRTNRTNALLIRAWVAGHITSLNSWVSGARDFLGPLTLDDALRQVTRFCRAHPRSTLNDAVLELEYRLIQDHGIGAAEPPAL